MYFLRNPEIHRLIFIYTAIAVMLGIAGGVFSNSLWITVYVAAACAIIAAVSLTETHRRYREIAALSSKIDGILHGAGIDSFVPDREGELALLSSEIYKLVVRLMEQAEALEQEKNYLADSLADISHQIRTPLTSMRMLVPRLGRDNMDAEARGRYVRETGQLLNRMEWLMMALLKTARLESGAAVLECDPVKIDEVLDEALEPLEIQMELKGIAVDRQVQVGACYQGDLHWSIEAVGNILKNCMEHMPKGGTLSLRASENPLYTELMILDDGEGIAKEDLPHLFERFYRGEHAGPEQAGIGLSLSRMIIGRQNGTIWAGNRTPHGAEFKIRFYKGAV